MEISSGQIITISNTVNSLVQERIFFFHFIFLYVSRDSPLANEINIFGDYIIKTTINYIMEFDYQMSKHFVSFCRTLNHFKIFHY